MRSVLFSLLLFISVLLNAQLNRAINFSTAEKSVFPFANTVLTDFGKIPFFVENIVISSDEKEFQPTLSNLVVKKINASDLPAEIIAEIPVDFSVTVRNSEIKKSVYSTVFIGCLRKNPTTGEIERLVSYQLGGHEISGVKDTPALKRTYASTSVLESGTWYKINTSQAGIHKVSYENLEDWGIDVTAINPADIRLFSNGPRMLPELNSTSRYDDLTENAIYVNDGNDGTFDPGDYFLFYTEGILYWTQKTNKSFAHSTNLYNDKNVCFLTFDNGPGLRMSSLVSETSPATHNVTRFLDFMAYEQNLYNLIKSGKNWFGDNFESTSLSKSYSFAFANICTDSLVKVSSVLAGRSSSASYFTISSGSHLDTADIAPTSGYQNDYAKTGSSVLSFTPSSSSVPVTITYHQNGNAEAMGWLDYIEVSAWRNLTFAGNQMTFRNPNVTGAGNIAEYTVANADNSLQIWDMTNPLKPALVQGNLSSGNYTFRVSNDSLRQFIAFNGVLYHTPAYVGTVDNQNLHALPQTDYLIVTYPAFRSQAAAIGQLHEQVDGYSYVVASPEEIYNEFSGGKQDPAAIRDFVKMFYDRASSADDMPKFLLLLGDASYDYKNRITNNNNLVPTFESANSLSPTASYATDDFFGLLGDIEGEDCNGSLDLGVGRIPVNTTEEANDVISKLSKYTSPTKIESSGNDCTQGACIVSNMADWRNQICFVADDGNGNMHFEQADEMAQRLDTANKFLNIDKIYLDAYKQVSTTGGERCPEANDAIRQRVEKGALIVNYTGHGGEVGWTLERILDVPTIQGWTNGCNMSVFITATCEFSRFDDPGRVSAGEYVFLNPLGGGIALLTTTRLAYASYNEALNNSFYDKAFDNSSGRFPTLGELIAHCKTDNGSVSYLRNFMLMGDPALTMTVPENQVITTEINGVGVSGFNDTISALKHVTIKGYIADPSGVKMTDFNGTLYPTVYDKATELETLANNPAEDHVAPFTLQKSIIYKGKASILNGEFSFSFIVPKDIQYTFGNGKISYYAENGSIDATGWYEDFIIGGSSDTILDDNAGPVINLFLNSELFVSGGTTNENPVILANMSDESGINTVGTGIGHDIIATLDGNSAESVVLNDYYEAEKDSYTNGSVRYPFKSLSEGPHTLTLKAWDILNNSSEASIEFIVSSSAGLALTHVLNYPNPFTTRTEFWFEHNQPCCGLDVQIQIFTITGKLVKTISRNVSTNGFRADPIEWDGNDDFGSPLARGVYIYRLRVKNADGQYAEKSEKLVILK